MSVKAWDKKETFQLIEQYKNYPELWNIHHHFYRNQKKKVKILRILANTFRTTEDEIKRKLHNLRSQFLQEKKRENRQSYWPFYKSLKFIRKGMRATKIQFLDEDSDEDNEDEKDDNYLIYNVETSYTNEPSIKKENDPDEETVAYESPSEIIDTKDVLLNQYEENNKDSRFQDVTYMDLTTQEEKVSDNEEKKHITNHLENPDSHESCKKRRKSLKEKVLRKALKFMEKPPDEHQIFGEYVANELRHIKSIQIQKELKRIIQQNIVAMSAKDDKLNGYGGRYN